MGSEMCIRDRYTGAQVTFGVSVVGGVLIGAFGSACANRTFNWHAFEDLRDLSRYTVGGFLMGVGGVLAFGCTVGQGVAGVSTLSIGSWLALGAILAGAFVGTRYLEAGSLMGLLRSWRTSADGHVS